jgi:tetratricopeptide (TPR) repeat protein
MERAQEEGRITMGNAVTGGGARATLAALVAAIWLVATAASGAPFVPTDDARVLERLPGGTAAQLRQLKSMQAASAQSPNDVARATALATAHIRASRVEGDPRFLGYAQAALAPWWKDPAAPTPVLLLRATILQSSHQFTPALADLGRVLERDPKHAQALLTRATVLTVMGRYRDARIDCDRLAGIAPEIYKVVCIAAIDSVTGNAGPADEAVRRTLRTASRLDSAGRTWGETLLGEIAQRRGDPAAEAHFRAALAGERDIYVLGAYGDWLLDQGRAEEVVELLGNETRIDPLLLRLALAQAALKRPDAAASIETLGARYEASRARRDTSHQRDNARFELALAGNPRQALALALENWNVQREPADLRILAEAAAATGDAAALGVVKQWLTETGLEYPAVAALVAGKAPAK